MSGRTLFCDGCWDLLEERYTLNRILVTIVIGFLVYECIEHIVFPVVWLLLQRRRKSPCGPEGLSGKTAEVRHWQGVSGMVFVDGELWQAHCVEPLSSGEKVTINAMDGLILSVSPLKPSHNELAE